MYRKKCPHCERVMYRREDVDVWKCLFCDADLTDIEAEFIEKKKPPKKGGFKRLK